MLLFFTASSVLLVLYGHKCATTASEKNMRAEVRSGKISSASQKLLQDAGYDV